MASFPQRLKFLPGVNKTDTPYSQEGRWSESDNMRSVDGRPESIGGWIKYYSTALTGVCRSMKMWADLDRLIWLGLGTHKKLLTLKANTLTDRTPSTASGTLANNPITTTSGSATVSIAHTTHGRAVNDYVIFGGATAVGGITVDGEYTVVTVTNANAYTITHSASASSTATGGGASVTYNYLLSPGLLHGTTTYGYGSGLYGASTYGTARATGTDIQARIWALDPWGENLLALPRGGNLYEFDVDSGTQRAVIVTNAPTGNLWMFVTPDKHVMILGAGGDFMKFQWSGQGDNTVWTPSATNQAGSYNVVGGSKLVGGIPISAGLSLAWSDAAMFSVLYTQDDFVYRINRINGGLGLIGPLAAIEHGGAAYWMSPAGFHRYNGAVDDMPGQLDIRDWVLGRLNMGQKDKCIAGKVKARNEIWFFYPSDSAGNSEIDSVVVYSVSEGTFMPGTVARTAWHDPDMLDTPLASHSDSYVYQHETGLTADGSTLTKSVKSAPIDLGDGDRSMDIDSIVIDLQNQSGTVNVTLYCADSPRGTVETFGPYAFDTATAVQGVRASGRQVQIEFSGDGAFRLGDVRLYIRAGGRRAAA